MVRYAHQRILKSIQDGQYNSKYKEVIKWYHSLRWLWTWALWSKIKQHPDDWSVVAWPSLLHLAVDTAGFQVLQERPHDLMHLCSQKVMAMIFCLIQQNHGTSYELVWHLVWKKPPRKVQSSNHHWAKYIRHRKLSFTIITRAIVV
jgi:hypothetical protein